MDEEKKEESESTENNEDGVQPTTDEEVKRINEDTERINKAIAENENAKARQKMSGRAEGGTEPAKPEPETDEEYTERFEKGEVNPLKV